MKLHDLKPAHGSITPPYRRGQGPGSGNGKTAGRGQKGQTSRTGSGRRIGFEGGQNPLYRRLPKRGFHNIFRKNYCLVNLDTLEKMFAGVNEVTLEAATKRGLLKPNSAGLKVLGDGEITRPIIIHAHRVSAGAKQKIEAAGGRIELVADPAPTK